VGIAGKLVEVGQGATALQANCMTTLFLDGFKVARKTSYVATFEFNDINGEALTRRETVRGT
jgi:hypothetical protein